MKTTVKNMFLLLFLSVFVFPLGAQKIYEGQITVNPRELSQIADSLVINIDVDLSGLVMEKDRSLSLIPLLISQNMKMELPAILINGGRRHRSYNRKIALHGRKDIESVYTVVKVDKNTNKTLNYRFSIPFELWMKQARLDLKEDLCGCAGHTRQIAIDKLIATVLMEGESRYDVKPLLSYIRPQVEEIKKRREQHEAFLDFPVAKAEIKPTYMNNPHELQKIETMLRDVWNDKNQTITNVVITGYASPEGSATSNDKLSRRRADALRSFLVLRTTLSDALCRVEQGGEDWVGLERLIEESTVANKSEILSVIRSGKTEDEREQALRRIGGGSAFRELLNDYFPKLRRVLCTVNYTVRGFDVVETKEIIKKSPQQLSLEEMFLLANTYGMEERAFSDVFETAVRLFPDDKIANLNAAASALQWGDTERAKNYLDKTSVTTKEYINNLGVYYLLRGEYDKARSLFDRAIKEGVTEAEHNRQELNRKLEVEEL